MKKQHHKRFGTIAVDKGFISEEQLIKALELQAKENIAEGKHRNARDEEFERALEFIERKR